VKTKDQPLALCWYFRKRLYNRLVLSMALLYVHKMNFLGYHFADLTYHVWAASNPYIDYRVYLLWFSVVVILHRYIYNWVPIVLLRLWHIYFDSSTLLVAESLCFNSNSNYQLPAAPFVLINLPRCGASMCFCCVCRGCSLAYLSFIDLSIFISCHLYFIAWI
jgi:hypothetical protein